MKLTELLRLVWLNINQNKFKSIMTSIGIVVGAATIVLVIAIGRGGQMDVAEQFASLNAGAIDISYEWEGEETGSGNSMFGSFGNMFGNFMMGGSGMGGNSGFFGGRSGSSDDAASGSAGNAMGEMPSGSMGGTDDASGNTFGGRGDFSGGGAMGEMPQMGENGEMPQMGEDGEIPQMGEDGEMTVPGDGNEDQAENTGGAENGDGAGSADNPANGDGAESADNSENGDGAGSADDPENGDGAENGERAGNADGSDGADQENAEDSNGSENSSENAEAESETEDSVLEERLNQESIILTADDLEDIQVYVPGITGATISYSSRASIEGGDLEEAQTYTVAGVKNSFASVSNLTLAAGEFISDTDDNSKSKVCVLGATAAKELFGSVEEAYDSSIYIDDREYTVIGVLETMATVSSGITPDETVFVPYETGIKYITGESISPTITVIAEDVNNLDAVIADLKTVLAENYSTAEFTFSDAGSEMEAAEASNQILTLLLAAMAAIVFVVGGIGIMNVLFVSVKERTNEIGVLKSMGASRKVILFEFLLESAAISFIGGMLGVGISFAITPIVEYYDIRVEASPEAWLAALGFAVLTGTLFGIYPAWKASRLVPVDALNAE